MEMTSRPKPSIEDYITAWVLNQDEAQNWDISNVRAVVRRFLERFSAFAEIYLEKKAGEN